MAERIESGKRFPALLHLQISDSVGIIPRGFLSERTLYARTLLSDNSEAETVYHRGPVVPKRIHDGEFSCYLAQQFNRPERLAAVCGNSSVGIGRNPRC